MMQIIDETKKEEEMTDFKVQSQDVPVESKPDPVIARIVPPHLKKSREVTLEDIDRVVEEVKVLHEICFKQIGLYKGAYAMHHSQIDDKDPLNFFVTSDARIIINPVIKRHSNYTVESKEACMTFPNKEQIVVPRWQKMEVEFVTIMVDPDNKEKFILSSPIQKSLSGFEAFVFCHEYDHGQAKYIYLS